MEEITEQYVKDLFNSTQEEMFLKAGVARWIPEKFFNVMTATILQNSRRYQLTEIRLNAAYEEIRELRNREWTWRQSQIDQGNIKKPKIL